MIGGNKMKYFNYDKEALNNIEKELETLAKRSNFEYQKDVLKESEYELLNKQKKKSDLNNAILKNFNMSDEINIYKFSSESREKVAIIGRQINDPEVYKVIFAEGKRTGRVIKTMLSLPILLLGPIGWIIGGGATLYNVGSFINQGVLNKSIYDLISNNLEESKIQRV